MADRSSRFAAGVHLPWSEVPERIRAWAVATFGPIETVEDLHGGFSPGCCTLLRRRDGTAAFVKAVGVALNPESPSMHRREARLAAALPVSAQLPRFIGGYDDGDWVALLYEEVPGRMPRHPWEERELDAVLEGLVSLHRSLTPCPVGEVEPTSVRAASVLSGWHELASGASLPGGVDEWALRHLDRLVALEEECLMAVDDGDTLVHGDIRSDNVLLAPRSVVFVDWPHASRGAAVFDLVAWAPSVALEGGPNPEELLARYRPPRASSADQVTAIVAGVAGFFAAQASRPHPPGLPTLRAFQAAQGQVALEWLRARTRWR
jgi:aminoglycoside phosphotransferase